MHRYLPLCLIVGLVIAFRVMGAMLPDSQPNFQPLAALFFCGALLASGWRGFAIPFAIWAVTYPIAIGPVTNLPIFLTTLLALTATFFLGKALSQQGFPILLLGSLAASVTFHLITNSAAWLGDPMYQKSLTGFWQSIWSGPPGSTIPSWIFFRNLTAANFLFTAIFVGSQLRLPKLSDPLPESLPAK